VALASWCLPYSRPEQLITFLPGFSGPIDTNRSGRPDHHGAAVDELEEDKGPHLEGAEVTVEHWREGAGTVVVRITGEVDMSNAASVQETVDQVVGSGVEGLIFDLGGLEFIDSSGLAVLLAAAQKVPSVRLRNPSSIVLRVVEVTGLSETLPTEP
jgi:anti-anti-sigma factor